MAAGCTLLHGQRIDLLTGWQAGARSPPAGKRIPSPDGSHKPAGEEAARARDPAQKDASGKKSQGAGRLGGGGPKPACRQEHPLSRWESQARDGCARAACLCSASLKVVDADPISACKGKSAARWVELGDPDPPPAENLRSPSRPRHVIFFARCIFTPALLPGAYARSRLRHLSAVVVGLCSRCSLTACRCRGRPAAATSGAR